eukprot:5650245-Ditylum_brightwellii.AAC.1
MEDKKQMLIDFKWTIFILRRSSRRTAGLQSNSDGLFYHGSCGSGLTHHLYKDLTGLFAGNTFKNCGHDSIVEGESKMDHSIPHLRHLLYALPSYVRQQFETVNNIHSHTQLAPLKFWSQWWDENFVKEIKD